MVPPDGTPGVLSVVLPRASPGVSTAVSPESSWGVQWNAAWDVPWGALGGDYGCPLEYPWSIPVGQQSHQEIPLQVSPGVCHTEKKVQKSPKIRKKHEFGSHVQQNCTRKCKSTPGTVRQWQLEVQNRGVRHKFSQAMPIALEMADFGNQKLRAKSVISVFWKCEKKADFTVKGNHQ